MKTFSFVERSSIRVLSPRILPLLFMLLGSIARTAMFRFCADNKTPRDSIKVLFPTPGVPVIPIRIEFPAWGRHFSIIF